MSNLNNIRPFLWCLSHLWRSYSQAKRAILLEMFSADVFRLELLFLWTGTQTLARYPLHQRIDHGEWSSQTYR